jgi:antitoxin (DNA-binding transcriptional repressor) of toxin-antitoxin stability system
MEGCAPHGSQLNQRLYEQQRDGPAGVCHDRVQIVGHRIVGERDPVAQDLLPIEDWHLNSYNSYMEKASVSKLKNNLSAYLRTVRAGHPVVIYDREVPIARLERIESAGVGSERLASLHAKGVTRLPLRKGSVVAILAGLQNPLPHATRLLEAVQQDRSEDR